MADLKISQLTAVTTPLAETEVLPIVQSGVTKKVTVAELTTLINHTMTMKGTNVLQFGDAGYTASINYNGDGSLRIKPRAGYPLQIDLANIKFSNAGYGIDFSATAGTGTSELLSDYEEGTWTPVVRGSGAAGTYQLASSAAVYTKIGRLVTLNMTLTTAGTVTGGGTGYLQITGVPFANAASTAGTVYLQGIDFTADYVVCNFTSASGSTTLYFEEVRDAAAAGDLPIASIATMTRFGWHFSTLFKKEM